MSDTHSVCEVDSCLSCPFVILYENRARMGACGHPQQVAFGGYVPFSSGGDLPVYGNCPLAKEDTIVRLKQLGEV